MYSHFTKLILSLAAAAVLGYLISGLTGLFAACCAVLLGYLFLHLYQINRLFRWLKSPKLNNLPRSGNGIWAISSTPCSRKPKAAKKESRNLLPLCCI